MPHARALCRTAGSNRVERHNTAETIDRHPTADRDAREDGRGSARERGAATGTREDARTVADADASRPRCASRPPVRSRCRVGIAPSAAALLEPLWLAAERVLGLSELNRLYAQRIRFDLRRTSSDRMLGALDVSIEARGDLRPLRDARAAHRRRQSSARRARWPRAGVARGAGTTRRAAARQSAAHEDPGAAAGRSFPSIRSADGAAVADNRQPLRDAIRWVRQRRQPLRVSVGRGLAPQPRRGSPSRTRRGPTRSAAWFGSPARGSCRASSKAETAPAFQLAGLVHPALRTLLLPRALVGQRGSRVVVHVGDPVTATACARRPRPRDDRRTASRDRGPSGPAPLPPSTRAQPLAAEVAPILARDTLLRSDAFAVFTTTAAGRSAAAGGDWPRP